jgi:hypothetical protein
MDPIQIGVAIIMLAVAFAGIMWLQSSEATASAKRMMAMMKRSGLDPVTAMLGSARAVAIGKDVRRRCKRCPREDLCDRWLAGTVKGGNSFCPNAQAFSVLAGAGGNPSATASRV